MTFLDGRNKSCAQKCPCYHRDAQFFTKSDYSRAKFALDVFAMAYCVKSDGIRRVKIEKRAIGARNAKRESDWLAFYLLQMQARIVPVGFQDILLAEK